MMFSQEPSPARRVSPKYPKRAQEREKEGSAIVRFTIAVDGSVKNVQLVQENPGGYGFGEAAVKAVGQWKYDPQIRDGKPVERPVQLTVEFNLE